MSSRAKNSFFLAIFHFIVQNGIENSAKKLKRAYPFNNCIRAINKSISPFDKSISPFDKSINAFNKSINAFDNCINSFDKSINAFDKSINAFDKSINAFNKSINSFDKNANGIIKLIQTITITIKEATMSQRIPRKDAELKSLADIIISGLKTDPEIFKAPPFTFEQLTQSVNDLTLAIDNIAQNKASYDGAIMAKDLHAKELYKQVTEVAEYCYRVTKENKALLAKVGLTPRAKPKPVETPGRCRDFTVVKQNINGAIFKWKNPETGGKVRAYIIQRQEADDTSNTWTNIWTEFGKEAEIKNQPQNKVFEYRARALNNSGIGEPSNTIILKF